MRLLIQRIKEAKVLVDGETIGRAGAGLCLFLAVAREDNRDDADYLARKAAGLRIFPDENGKLNRSIAEAGGEILVVSEFTLYGDAAKGKRPSFSRAAPPGEARPLYDYFIRKLKDLGLRVAAGQFQAEMEVALVNHGPVTLILDSRS